MDKIIFNINGTEINFKIKTIDRKYLNAYWNAWFNDYYNRIYTDNYKPKYINCDFMVLQSLIDLHQNGKHEIDLII